MATSKAPAAVQESATTADAASIADAASAKAKVHSDALGNATFDELSKAIMTKATWNDVLAAADRLANMIERLGMNEKTATAQARRLGVLAPSDVWHFRMAITTYALSGRRANDAQNAQLTGKLPSLRKQGELKANEQTFGGLIIPSVLAKF